MLGLSAAPRGGSAVLTEAVHEHTLWVNRVPEPKTVKHRVHLDVHTRDLVDADGDPEGNEFCVFTRS